MEELWKLSDDEDDHETGSSRATFAIVDADPFIPLSLIPSLHRQLHPHSNNLLSEGERSRSPDRHAHLMED